jgi:hypothetical protein
MFKLITAMALSLVMITAALAGANHSPLKMAFDELQYSLTVEWDQQDQKFHDEQKEKFRQTMIELLDNGLPDAELGQLIRNEVKDERALQEIETVLGLVSMRRMNQQEAEVYLNRVLERAYAKGANWQVSQKVGLTIVAAYISVCIWALATGRAKLVIG